MTPPLRLSQLFCRTILVSFAYAPPALLLAFTSLALVAVPTISGHIPRLSGGVLGVAVGGWLLVSHALFIGFLGELIIAGRQWRTQLARAGRGAVRAAPHLALLVGAACLLALASPWTFPVAWAVATFLSLPRHFAGHGFRGWTVAPAASPVAAWRRLTVMAPTAVFLGLVVWLLSRPGLDWGFMDGGMVLAAIMGGATFWASYACALFSAAFAAPPGRLTRIRPARRPRSPSHPAPR